MSTEPKHTPLPWDSPLTPFLSRDGEGLYFSGGDYAIYPPLGESGPVAVCGSKEDAEYIVRACNAFPELVAALKNLVDACDGNYYELVQEAKAAIAKAQPEGES